MTLDLFLEILIKSTALLVLGLTSRALVKKENPALRHLILLITIVGSMAIPITLPLVSYQTKISIPQNIELGNDQTPTGEVRLSQIIPSDKRQTRQITQTIPIKQIAFGIWVLGFCFVITRYCLGLVSLSKLRQIHSELNQPISPIPGTLFSYEVRRSSTISPKTAMTWGVFRSVIMLPQDSINWTSHRMDMILLHELAHVRRRDFVSQLLAELACAIYWFNPLVWQSAHAMRDDAELAADDAVLRTGIRPSDYATELLQIAANLSKKNFMLNRVGISTMTHPKIESRLTAILSSSTKTRGITTVSALVALSLSGIAVTPISSIKLHQNPTPAQLKAQSMSRLKMISLATMLYSQDFDDLMPNATSTKNARTVLSPYVKDQDWFKSPRTKSDFQFNLNVSGINISTFKNPAETVLWYEVTPKGTEPNVAYVDGHVKTIQAEDVDGFERALRQKYPRGGVILPSSGIGR